MARKKILDETPLKPQELQAEQTEGMEAPSENLMETTTETGQELDAEPSAENLTEGKPDADGLPDFLFRYSYLNKPPFHSFKFQVSEAGRYPITRNDGGPRQKNQKTLKNELFTNFPLKFAEPCENFAQKSTHTGDLENMQKFIRAGYYFSVNSNMCSSSRVLQTKVKPQNEKI